MPADESFWLHFLTRVVPDFPLSVDDRLQLEQWRPERSNCPELTGVVEDLIESMPPDWQPLASELFVGRVLDGEVNATAETSRRARIVRITLQYTNVLHAYVTVFDEQRAALNLLLGEIKAGGPDREQRVAAIDSERFAHYWYLIEQGRSDWHDRTQIVGLVEDLRIVAAPERSDLRAQSVLLAETWVICHEIAHHLLGHTLRSGKQLPADELVAQYREPDLMRGLNKSQRSECDADVLAYLLLARACRPEEPPSAYDLYGAETGAALALVALTHVTDAWGTSYSDEATHPGFDVRWALLDQLTCRLSQGMPTGKAGDHPQDLLIDLTLFASAAYDAARLRSGGDAPPRLTLLDLASAALDRKEELRAALHAETDRTP
jgi:hypothetical protein